MTRDNGGVFNGSIHRKLAHARRYSTAQKKLKYRTVGVVSKYAEGTPEVRSRCGRGTLEVRSRYPRSTLRSHLLRKELQPRLRRERAEKLARMARLLRPTEPRPPAAQRASLELVLRVFRPSIRP